MARALDAARLEVMRHLLASVPEEMGAALKKTAFSPNVKERRDYSCAIFDGGAAMIAQAAHIPVHLGSTPLSVRAAIESGPLERGDMVLLNDPFRGGTHLPDLTLVAPVFLGTERRPSLFVANRAHHADVGGMAPGSMALATEIFQEGLRIPPVRFVRKGEVERDLLDLVLANVRTPLEREGDLRAQIAANAIGARRLTALAERVGKEALLGASGAILDYSERLLRGAIATWPRGTFRAEDALDDDGLGSDPVPIRVSVTVSRGGSVIVDFGGTAPQVRGGLNANEAVTLSAVLYAIRCAADRDVPVNDGCFRPIRLVAPRGTVVNALFPASVAGGNVETSQRIVDVVFRALARALPRVVPAASAGSMSNLTLGGADPRTGAAFTYYETIAGGMGARPGLDGLPAVQTHMTNTLNTPIEALETYFPVRVRAYAIRRGSGGRGKARGGDGLVRAIEALAPVEAAILSERRRLAPYGLRGGRPGKRGENALVRKNEKTNRTGATRLPGKWRGRLAPGDILVIATPGGGGHGRAG